MAKPAKNEYQYTRMPFGMHKGLFLSELPKNYLSWLCQNIEDKAQKTMFQTELNRRYTLD